MVQFLNSHLSKNKKSINSVCEIYGLGRSSSEKLCGKVGLSQKSLKKHMNDNRLRIMSKLVVEYMSVDVDLKRFEYLSLKNHMSLNSYKGSRLKKGLPSNGQRTKTNARTSRKKQVILN